MHYLPLHTHALPLSGRIKTIKPRRHLSIQSLLPSHTQLKYILQPVICEFPTPDVGYETEFAVQVFPKGGREGSDGGDGVVDVEGVGALRGIEGEGEGGEEFDYGAWWAGLAPWFLK
jgi:hypothetical protein